MPSKEKLERMSVAVSWSLLYVPNNIETSQLIYSEN